MVRARRSPRKARRGWARSSRDRRGQRGGARAGGDPRSSGVSSPASRVEEASGGGGEARRKGCQSELRRERDRVRESEGERLEREREGVAGWLGGKGKRRKKNKTLECWAF